MSECNHETEYTINGHCRRCGEVVNAPSELPAPTGSAIVCKSCGYSGAIDTYLPSMSPYADCKCPECGSTNNQHNSDYAAGAQKAWSCKHVGTLTDGGTTMNGQPLLKCTECGSIGLDWAMRGERPTSANAKENTEARRGCPTISPRDKIEASLRDWQRILENAEQFQGAEQVANAKEQIVWLRGYLRAMDDVLSTQPPR